MRRALPGGWPLQFLLLSATWGSSFLFIKVLDRHWTAVWVAFGRVFLGAATLVALTIWQRERLAFEPRVWGHLVVAALLFNVVPFTLFAYGEQHVPSLVAGLWNATTPLWVLVILLLAFEEERPNAQRVFGLAVGFGGVIVLLGPWRELGGGELRGQLACGAAALCYGLGFPYTRQYLASRALSGVSLSAGQLLCATLLLALALPFTRGPTLRIGLDGTGSLLALGMMGTGVAYALNYAIVRAAGSAVASTVTYVIPIFATVLGVVVLGESLSWNQPMGAAVLLSGVALTQRRVRRPGAVVRAEPGRLDA